MNIHSLTWGLIGLLIAGPATAQQTTEVHLDSSQAQAALVIMDAVSEGSEPTPEQWRALETSRPYLRLKEREASFNVGFTDADFRRFLSTPDQLARRTALADTLRLWNDIDMAEAGQRAFAYLPEGARLDAEVYFMIKPRRNSFVWDLTGEPAIFLYLDPAESAAKTRNTIAHELHHVGLGRACPASGGGSDARAVLRRWSSAFGEGLAMIAAAGGPDSHPHADSPAAMRAVWDASLERFDEDFRRQDAFFSALLRGEAGDDDAVAQTMVGYFGEQGPWYTVGWKMAQVIERSAGRRAVVDAYCHQGHVFAAYNDAARHLNTSGETLPLWSEEIVAAMAAPN